MAKNSDIDKSTNANYDDPFSYSNEIIKKIPLIGEKFSYTKRTKEGQINIEKRWTSSIKKIEIPVNYEEIYIDGKKIDSFDNKDIANIFSKIINKIKYVFLHSKNQEHNQTDTDKDADTLKVKYHNTDNNILNEKQSIESGKSIPLFHDKKNPKSENVITIWGEEIIINKRKVKLGEFVIRKYEVTETKKVDVELMTEKLIIHHPNSPKEEII
ncbi:MAG: DUF2382 domain-containing protein [Candidatus Nitrosocosmicus sp.]